MSQRNRSTRSQRDLNRSPRPSTSQRRRRDSSSDYSELHDLSLQTQDELRENEKKMYVLAVSKYILAMTKKKLPMKCNELVKHCMHGEHRLFSEIFPLVSNQLADVSLVKIMNRCHYFNWDFSFHDTNSCTVWKRTISVTKNWAKSFYVRRV